MMIRSLTFKWIAILLITSLVGVVLVGLFAYRTAVSGYDRLRVEQAQTTFVSEAADYYQANNSWAGIETWLKEQEPKPGQRFSMPQLFALANADGTIIAGYGPFHINDRLNEEQIQDSIPIMVGEQVVGRALLATPPPNLDPREERYINSTNQALLIGAIGAISLALLIGILLSRQFLRPLNELTSAIHAMKQGHLNQQVQVRTRDELGDLVQTFNQMSAEIHRVNQQRQQMTADIAHELRTPLMVLSGYIEALRDGTLPATAERFDAMNQEAAQLKRLVEDLRTLSLADAGKLKLAYQTVKPAELLAQVKQSFEPLVQEQQVALKLDVEQELPTVQIDPERMVQVLANIVSNALRYTPNGGTVTLEARYSHDAIELAVSDTGKGIPAEKLPNIFERFYRVEESRYQSEGESGLGLAIAKSIVEAHHGTIAAKSDVGRGTSVIIRLKPSTI
ncbi:MAG: HAMP domain-containing protein [Anaerolineae bacterium]|nr:HAMP domain-containing protein [Anaerolineae bacterium]